MKTLTSIIICLFFVSSFANATVRTVSNVGGAQYGSLQAAKDASVNGDTLLIQGTPFAYYLSTCNDTWNKSLVVIGIGINPTKQLPFRTMIAGTNCVGTFAFAQGGNGSKFYGIEFTTDVYILGTSYIDQYNFENCKFNSNFDYNNRYAYNTVFKNCIFDRDNNECTKFSSNCCAYNQNILYTNCVFDGFISGQSNPGNSVIFDHCIFLATNFRFENVQYTTISNSIFVNTINIQTGTSTANNYLNNISRLSSLPPGTGNIANTNPNFVSYTLGSNYNPAHNYNLQAGSAAIGTASDATDMGVNGGVSNFNESGEVLITPIMRTLIINNTSVAPNGTINVQINAGKPNDQ